MLPAGARAKEWANIGVTFGQGLFGALLPCESTKQPGPDMTRDPPPAPPFAHRPPGPAADVLCGSDGCTRDRRFTLDCIFTDCTGSDVELVLISWWEIGRW